MVRKRPFARRWWLLFLSVSLASSDVAIGLASACQDPVGGDPLPFSVVRLQRRAQTLQKAAESLKTLLEGWDSGRLTDGPFESYFLERAELLRRLSKDIATDRNLRELARTRPRPAGDEKPKKPPTPTSLAEAVRMAEEAVELAAAVNEQVAEIAGDVNSFEVRVDELAKPDPIALCKRLQYLAERLAKSARDDRISRKP